MTSKWVTPLKRLLLEVSWKILEVILRNHAVPTRSCLASVGHSKYHEPRALLRRMQAYQFL